MIDLYFAPTTNGRRAAIMLAKSGLPFTVHPVSFARKPPALLSRNPAGTIPVIEDADGPGGRPIVVVQSGAIVLYLAEKIGRFIPTEPIARLVALQRFMLACSDVAAMSSAIYATANDLPEPSARNVSFYEDRLLALFKVVDGYLQDRDYLAGDISIADFAMYPVFFQRRAVADRAGGLARLTRWGDAMAARPAVTRAMALKGAA